MLRTFLKSKIHRAIVTQAELNYEGSVSLDPDLIEAADLLPFEKVEIYDIDNGNRLATYVIPGARGSGEVCINGAAARLVHAGDYIIICCYVDLTPDEVPAHSAKIIHVDQHNRIMSTDEKPVLDIDLVTKP